MRRGRGCWQGRRRGAAAHTAAAAGGADAAAAAWGMASASPQVRARLLQLERDWMEAAIVGAPVPVMATDGGEAADAQVWGSWAAAAGAGRHMRTVVGQ